MFASDSGHTETALKLIELGANKDFQDKVVLSPETDRHPMHLSNLFLLRLGFSEK